MTLDRHKLPLDGLWHDCPSCGYKGGWHVFFRRTSAPSALQMDLQCPDCGGQFNLGLRVSVEE
jgi:DNA-directed RNA polymerase subunit RPC12/RpoP